jgi:murein L,D-transpeptidase YcbB/YkuD
MVVAALEKTSKDRALVETELATRVAEKLVGWGKLFGVLLALPVAALLLILSLFGISKFEDLRSAVANADALVTQAKTRLTEGGKQLEDVTTQLAQLQTQLEKSSTAAEAKIRELNGAVNEVQTTTSSLASLAFGASGANIKDVQTRVKDVQTRLKELGFFQGEPDGVYGPTTLSAVRDFQVKNGITPDGVVGPQTSSLLFKDK